MITVIIRRMKLTKRATGINFSRKTALTAKATASQPASKRKTMAETKHKRHTHSFILCAFLSFLISLALFFPLLSRSLCSFLNPLLFRCLCICCLKETVQHCCSLASSLFDRIALIFLWVSARASLVRHSLYFISHMRLKTHAQELFTFGFLHSAVVTVATVDIPIPRLYTYNVSSHPSIRSFIHWIWMLSDFPSARVFPRLPFHQATTTTVTTDSPDEYTHFSHKFTRQFM